MKSLIYPKLLPAVVISKEMDILKRGLFNWHNLLMLVCVIPMALIVIGLFNNGSLLTNFNAGSLWPLAMLLICPLMHLFMMRGMNHGKSCHQGKDETVSQDANTK